MATPYGYLIGWKELKTWYLGVQYGERYSVAGPENLWKTSFTSSKHVRAFRKEHGEPDVVKVLKTFGTPEEALAWETETLKRINAAGSKKWLNRTNGNNEFLCLGHTPETRRKMAASHKGKSSGMAGKHHSNETRAKLSRIHTGRIMTPEWREKIRVAASRRKHTEETKRKLSEIRKVMSR